LPRRIRFAAAVCLVLSGLTGLVSLKEALELGHLSEAKEAQLARLPGMGDAAVNAALIEAHYAALEPMREPRSLILIALSVACAFTFIASSRLLRPDGLPLESMRRLLGGAAIATAILRTMDGAQLAVVFRRMGEALGKVMSFPPEIQDPAELALLRSFAPVFLTTAAVLWTGFIAGMFALLGQYFRSERVRQVITAQDGPQEEED
jgi:hypothetical protein